MTATTPDEVQGQGRLEQPVRLAILAGSALAAAAVLFALGALNPLTVILVGAVLYCVVIYVSSRVVEGHRHATDRLVTGVVTTTFLLAMVPLVSVIWTIFVKGLGRFDAEFFTYSMSGVTQGEIGGAYHAIVGTVITTGIATIISVPIGLFAAIYLVEYGNKGVLARGLTFFVDVMTGIPSIVAGLFAVGLFAWLLDDAAFQAGIVGAVALSVLMIPTVVRSSEEMLRLVPNELREASYALGVPKWLTIVKIVLPTSVAGLATGITLAIARVMGETAPLLITMGAAKAVNFNPFDGSMSSLPLFSYSSYATAGGDQALIDAAWTAALVLMVIVMVLNIVARLISKFFAPKTGR